MKHLTALSASLLALALATGTAPAQPSGDKVDAKSLMQSGLKLFAAKDYLGALAVFRTAYERFPSGKILLNIGTTLLKLDRKAEAANAYQRYLDTPGADPAKQTETKRVLGELDKELARLDIWVTPADAEVQINDGEWSKVAEVKRYRVAMGPTVVRGRRKGFLPNEESFKVGKGETRSVSLTLAEEPIVTTTVAPDGTTTVEEGGLRTIVKPARRSRIGALVAAHVDPKNQGAAVLLGLTGDVVSRLQAQAAALVGPVSGAYLSVTYGLLPGKLRPLVVVGMPVFFSEGPRFAVRGAIGVEYALDLHFSLFAEVGVEYMLNPEPMMTKALFIPALGVTGRL